MNMKKDPNVDWFKSGESKPAVFKYFVKHFYEGSELYRAGDPRMGHWTESRKVLKEEVISVSKSRYENSPYKHKVIEVSKAVIPYERVDFALTKHINKTKVNEDTKVGKLNSLTRAVKSYKSNYKAMNTVLDKQIRFGDEEASKAARKYKESMPTIEEMDKLLESIEKERKDRQNKKSELEKEINKLKGKISKM